ncbi:MAG: TonB-dependent receptor [Williamsia sp.]|nr:TonB-dependent receptor [Williamsia sp.]
MKKAILFLVLTLIVSATAIRAQNAATGALTGTITTSDGKPAAAITVTLKTTGRTAISNDEGRYIIKTIKPGTYTILVSAVGTNQQSKEITIAAGETVTLDFTITENAEQLQEVTVSSRNRNRETNTVAKMPLTNLENPQVYGTVSAELLKQQVITNYDDALRNVPGITRTWEATGRGGDGTAYFALRGFEAQAGLTNGLPGFVSGNLDPADVEEIQVLKGPSGTLFGGSFYGFGGIINTITKKPYYTFGGEVAYNVGSFGLNRVTADINTPLSKTEKIALRVNTAYHTEQSFQDAGFKKSFFIAPSLSYEINDRLSFRILTEVLEEERAAAPIFFHTNRSEPLPYKTIAELNLNPKLSFTSNDLTIRNPRYTFQGEMIYKLSPHWTSQTAISRGRVQSQGYYGYIFGNGNEAGYFEQDINYQNGTTNTTDVQQNFNADFNIGKVRNRLLIGLEYYGRNVVDNGSGYAFLRNVTPQGGVNYVDPATGDTLPPVYLTKASIDNLLAGTGVSNSNVSNYIYAAYISDVINITPKLSAMLSLRGDYFDSKGERSDDADGFHQTTLSPKFGLVYQPVLDKVSLFANYMNGFFNVDPISVADPDGSNPRIKSFRPQQADQFEAGVKANLFQDKLFATFSYYDITLSNRVIGVEGNINDYTQGGKVRSGGFEADISASPAKGLSLIAGYSYNHIRVTEGFGNDFYNEKDRAPGGQGPQNLANFWGTYRFTSGGLANFGFGVGGNYASQYKVVDNSVTGVFNLPSYALLNGSLFYNGDKVRCSFNINNITNKQYYIGYWSVNPQKRLNFAASIAYKF